MKHAPGPTSVLIPLFSTSGRGAVVQVEASYFEAVAVDSLGNDPRLVRLMDIGMQMAGAKALTFADRLPFPNAGRWRRMRLTLPRSPRALLAPVDPTVDLGGANDESAQLGLALAMVALHRGARDVTFVATGELAPQHAPEIPDRLGPVGPIGGLEQKIEAIGEWLRDHKGSHRGRRLLFFTPIRTEDGEKVADALAEPLAHLIEAAKALEIEIVHAPVATLAEAAERLGAFKSRLDPREIWAKAGAVLAASAAAALVALGLWAAVPTRIGFAPMDWALGPPEATPVVLNRRPDLDVSLPRAACFAEDQRRQLAFGEHLAIRIGTPPTWLPGPLVDLFFDAVIVAVSEHGSSENEDLSIVRSSQLHSENRPAKTASGAVAFTLSVAAKEPEGLVLVAIIARKSLAILDYDRDELQAGLEAAMVGKAGLARLRAAAAYLEDRPGAYLGVEFHARPDLSTCRKAL